MRLIRAEIRDIPQNCGVKTQNSHLLQLREEITTMKIIIFSFTCAVIVIANPLGKYSYKNVCFNL